jgi:hypothetical protein
MGCGDDNIQILDAAIGEDAGRDAARPDAALSDAALPDAASADSGFFDAGSLDAALPDASLVDAGAMSTGYNEELSEAMAALTGRIAPVPGTGKRCTAISDNRKKDRCYGFFCGTNSNSIKAGLTKRSPCATDAQVALICDGLGAREASRCARVHALDASPRKGTKQCMRANKKLKPFTNACLDCFLDSADCAREHCVAECLAGDNPRCDACREKHKCTPNYYKCSGLPNPM